MRRSGSIVQTAVVPSILVTPIVVWIPPPWDMQRNPDWAYERYGVREPFDGSAWVSEPAPPKPDPEPVSEPQGEGRP